MWFQMEILLKPRKRGFNLITQEVVHQVPELSKIRVGLCHLFIQHTSASLCLNENADPDVLVDLENYMSRLVPEKGQGFLHSAEGADDMPAHIRTALTHTSEQIPISNSSLLLGIWQGIYLWEHRGQGRNREVVVHVSGK